MGVIDRSEGKKARLTAAAITCFHRAGYANTSLAEISALAEVPLGNTYYYFRSKAALAEAVAAAWQARVDTISSELDHLPTPQSRLSAFLHRADTARSIYAEFGCPLANLARDLLASGEPALSGLASQVYAGLYAWVEAQFVEMGRSADRARSDSRFLVATLQGGILMAHVHQDDAFLTAQIAQLRRWLVRSVKETS